MSEPGRPAPLAPLEVDLAVVGSGAAGLSAALTAVELGLTVAVFEKDSRFGGTSAWCSGWMWIPGRKPMGAGDLRDAWNYLRDTLGARVFHAQKAKVKAFLKSGPGMLRFFESRFPETMKFEKDPDTPDFYDKRGQHKGGRMVRVPAFDGRLLGGQIEQLRHPLPEFTFFGLAIEAGADLNAFLASSRFFRSLRALRAVGLVTWRVAGYVYDLITCGRGMRLVNGNALIARMMACAAQRGDRLHLYAEHAVVELTRSGEAVDGLIVRTPEGIREVRAARGVVLACGGFPHDMRRIRELFPPALTGCGHRSAAPEQNTGDGLRLAERMGGQVGPTLDAAAALVPVSVRRRGDGSRAVYPHFVERAKPGVIAVHRDGRRFCDEAVGYHEFVQCWLLATPKGERLQAWLVGDLWSLLRFGLGMVKPGSLLPLGSLRSGYLKAGWTLEGLAQHCGMDAGVLREQVQRHNAAAPDKDLQFGKGESVYDRSQGDPLTRPNPCVGRIRLAPYFAVQLQAGSLGTLAGLRTDEHARVLDAKGKPIPGLHACGNDMAAVMGGKYPTNGVTLASAMIFGYRAARDIAAAAVASAVRSASAYTAAPAATAAASQSQATIP